MKQSNDQVIRQALKDGSPIFICVHKETGVVITNMGPRPLLYSTDEAADASNGFSRTGLTHKFVLVDPLDPFKDVFVEETDTGDKWTYHPLLAVEVDAGPSATEVRTAVEQFQKELSAVSNSIQLKELAEEYLDTSKPSIIVRHSELVDAASCLKRYQLAWIENLRPRKTDKKLVIGTLFHAFQEVYEKELAEHPQALDDCLRRGCDALDAKAKPLYEALPDIDTDGRAEILEGWQFAAAMCRGYHQWRTTDPVGMDLSAIQQPEAQFTFKIGEFNGVDVYLSGTMDGAGVTRETGELWLREYKTCQSVADKLKQYRVDKQTRRYVGAMRMQGVHFAGVELVLAAKVLPYDDQDFILKAKGREGYISRDKDKWSRVTVEQAYRIAKLGKFDEPDGKKGLTEEGFHDILKMLDGKPNPFFHVERLHFNDEEIATIMEETLIEAHRLHVTRETAPQTGNRIFTRNAGPMGFNCKSCSVRDICEMELKGVDTQFFIAEHFIVDASIHDGKEIDDTDE